MSDTLFHSPDETSQVGGPARWYTLPLSVLVHTLIVGASVVVPLVATGALPTPESVITFVTAPPSPSAPPEAPRTVAVAAPVSSADTVVGAAPLHATEGFAPEPPPGFASAAGGLPNVVAGAPVQLAPFQALPTAPDVAVRPGGDLKEPRKLLNVVPVYPPIARSARVEGVVRIEATIARDGTVRDARVQGTKSMLDQAALDAVRQWRYSPSLLNGVPVEVLMTVTVQFTLR